MLEVEDKIQEIDSKYSRFEEDISTKLQKM